MWRIGDGTKARVMHDMWLRIHGSSWIPSLQPQEVSNMAVADLLISHGNIWDAGKIIVIFPSNVANNIFVVPLFDIQGPDVLIWNGDTSRLYSVKSGYNNGYEAGDK
jgi:hypothetical protein